MMKMPDGGITMPERVQLARKTAVGAREHQSGQITMEPDEGYTMGYDSNTEMKWKLVLLARPGVAWIESQVHFQWLDADGKKGEHFFDFRVLMADGQRVAIMVKSEYRRNQLKVQDELAEVAARVPRSFADQVVVMTERDIDPVEYFNAEMMHEMRRPDPDADAAARRLLGEIIGAFRIQANSTNQFIGKRRFTCPSRTSYTQYRTLYF